MFFSFGNGFGFQRKSSGGGGYEDLLPILAVSPTSYDYGEHDTGTNTDYIFTLTNSGNEVAEDITVAVTGTGFSLLSSAGPFNVAAEGGYASITVRFNPSSAGAATGSLTLSWPNQDDIVVSLAGEGISSGVALIVNEGFEGTGIPSGWTTSGTDFSFDDTTAPVLVGTQQLKMKGNDGTTNIKNVFTDADEVWIRMKVRLSDVGAAPTFFYLRDLGGAAIATIRAVFGKLRVTVGTATADTAAAFNANTDYYVWFHYKKGTGVNAEGSIAFSTTGVMPTSGTYFASLTTGTSTTQAHVINIYNVSGMAGYYDDIKVSIEGSIGDA